MADLCGYIVTEADDKILCENGDNLVTECFVPPAPSTSLMPGKVWKGEYPYFKRRKRPAPYSPPYGPKPYDHAAEEELLILTFLDDG